MRPGHYFLGAAFLSLFILFAGCKDIVTPGSSKIHGQLETAQMFSLKDLDGRDVSLKNLLSKNKAVLINFWATWCPFCIEEIPDLVKLKNRHKDAPFEILGINVGESVDQAAPFAKKVHINYPVLLDSEGSVAESYGVVGIPSTFLIGQEGKIIGEYHAFTPQLEADIEKALQ